MQELQKLGWTEGRNIRFEYRWAAGDAATASGLRRRNWWRMAPDVILAANNTALRALATGRLALCRLCLRRSPIQSAAGYVASLARPGGNITGFALLRVQRCAVKWLELLKEIAPSIARVAVIYDPTDFNSKHMQEIEAVIASFGVQLSSFIIAKRLRHRARHRRHSRIQPHGGLIILPGRIHRGSSRSHHQLGDTARLT